MGKTVLRSLPRVDTLQARLGGKIATPASTTAATVSLPRLYNEIPAGSRNIPARPRMRRKILVANATIRPRLQENSWPSHVKRYERSKLEYSALDGKYRRVSVAVRALEVLR
jgi:hypothetical protein